MDAADVLTQATKFLEKGDSGSSVRLCKSFLNSLTLEAPLQSAVTQRQLAELHRIMAISLREHGSADEVLAHAQLAEELYREVDDQSRLGDIVLLQGWASQSKGEFDRSKSLYKLAQDYATKTGNLAQYARASCNLGNVFSELGNYHEAITIYRDALTSAKSLGDNRLCAFINGNLGFVYRHVGEWVLAVEALDDAIAVDSAIENHSGKARHIGNLGSVYQQIGQHRRAISLYEQAMDIHRQLGQKRHELTWCHNIAVAYQEIGELDLALKHFQFALEADAKFTTPLIRVRTMVRIADIYIRRQETAKAALMFDDALGVAKNHGMDFEVAILRSNYSSIFLTTGDYTRAHELLNSALPILELHGNKTQIASATFAMGRLLADTNNPQNDYVEANHWLTRAIELFTEIDAKLEASNAHHTLADLHRCNNEWKGAWDHLQLAYTIRSSQIHDETKQHAEHALLQRRIAELEQEKTQRQDEFQRKSDELQRAIDQMVEKNNLLQQITKQVRLAMKNARPQVHEILDDVNDMIERNMRSDYTLATLDVLVSDLYSDYISRLCNRAPSISPMEQKVAVLLSRELTSANIAHVLCISKRTVEVHRHNLRSKLGLSPKEDIYAALKDL